MFFKAPPTVALCKSGQWQNKLTDKQADQRHAFAKNQSHALAPTAKFHKVISPTLFFMIPTHFFTLPTRVESSPTCFVEAPTYFVALTTFFFNTLTHFFASTTRVGRSPIYFFEAPTYFFALTTWLFNTLTHFFASTTRVKMISLRVVPTTPGDVPANCRAGGIKPQSKLWTLVSAVSFGELFHPSRPP